MALTAKIKEKQSGMFETVIEEDGKIEWDRKNGMKREQILEVVGREYKQINLLAEIVAEIVKQDPNLASNPIIANAMAKFAQIEAIRKS